MELKRLRTTEAAKRVQGFLDHHRTTPGVNVTPVFRAEFDRIVAELDAYRLEQASATRSAKSETAVLKQYRHDLYEDYGSTIGTFAKSALRHVPEYRTLFLPSRPRRHGEWLATAMGVAASAAKYERELVAHGMRAGLVGEMREAIDRISARTAL
jgi:hypothetical protein